MTAKNNVVHNRTQLYIKVYLVPSDDPHLSEYVPAAYMRRGYLTDFHGSAGTALVTSAGKAILWTDSRYFNEASLSLDGDHWELMRQGEKNVPTVVKFLSDMAIEHHRVTRGTPLKVGMDAYVHSASFARELADAFADAAAAAAAAGAAADGGVNGGGSTDPTPPVVAVIDTLDGVPNIVDSIWEGRPALPKNPFRVHVSFADTFVGGAGVASWGAIYRFPHTFDRCVFFVCSFREMRIPPPLTHIPISSCPIICDHDGGARSRWNTPG